MNIPESDSDQSYKGYRITLGSYRVLERGGGWMPFVIVLIETGSGTSAQTIMGETPKPTREAADAVALTLRAGMGG